MERFLASDFGKGKTWAVTKLTDEFDDNSGCGDLYDGLHFRERKGFTDSTTTLPS